MRMRTLVLLVGTFTITLSAAVAKPDSSVQNGRAIFQNGRDLAGTAISASQRPLYPTCAACHRSNGAGGVHVPGGAVSADLRHRTLATMHPPYTVALLERAISKGIDNQGQRLSPVMPRWRLSKNDLHDVAQYVWTQLK
jgi:mono/diheme cytochrome c family protein